MFFEKVISGEQGRTLRVRIIYRGSARPAPTAVPLTVNCQLSTLHCYSTGYTFFPNVPLTTRAALK